MSSVSAYYWPFALQGWLGEAPKGWQPKQAIQLVGQMLPDSWKEAVVDRELSVGIRFTPERWGLVRFDFADWSPGMRSSDDTDELDFDEAVEVVMRRLKVMNVHLLLAHVSHLEVENMATETTRLSHDDLVHITDGGMGGPGLLRLPFAVSHLDFARKQTVSVAVLERSADLLDLTAN